MNDIHDKKDENELYYAKQLRRYNMNDIFIQMKLPITGYVHKTKYKKKHETKIHDNTNKSEKNTIL